MGLGAAPPALGDSVHMRPFPLWRGAMIGLGHMIGLAA